MSSFPVSRDYSQFFFIFRIHALLSCKIVCGLSTKTKLQTPVFSPEDTTNSIWKVIEGKCASMQGEKMFV